MKSTRPDAVLLALLGSGVALLTEATSLICATSVAVTETRTVVLPPLGSLPRVQVMVMDVLGPAVVGAQVPDGVTVTPVTEKGVAEVSTSVRTTPVAFDGPRLSTWMSQNPSAPALAGSSGLQTLVTARSARAWTVVVWVAVLLPGTGSNWFAAATEAVLVMTRDASLPRKPDGMPTWIANVVDWPASSEPSAQVSVPAAFVQSGLLDWKVTPAGRTSVTVTASAVLGPALRTSTV